MQPLCVPLDPSLARSPPGPPLVATRAGAARALAEVGIDASTPLHELWLTDPGGNLVEIYARLTDAELAGLPTDQEPVFLQV